MVPIFGLDALLNSPVEDAMLVCTVLGEQVGLVGIQIVATGRFEAADGGDVRVNGEIAHIFDVATLIREGAQRGLAAAGRLRSRNDGVRARGKKSKRRVFRLFRRDPRKARSGNDRHRRGRALDDAAARRPRRLREETGEGAQRIAAHVAKQRSIVDGLAERTRTASARTVRSPRGAFSAFKTRSSRLEASSR